MQIEKVFGNNEKWIAEKLKADPGYFENLSKGQNPEILYIGCSDSRVTAEDLMGVQPGEAFVHRNIANVVVHTDMNCLSVLQYAVEVLNVKHVIVCGHYGCGGVQAAMHDKPYGLIDNWLRNIKDIHTRHGDELDAIEDETARCDRLCELNVMHQLANVCYTTIVQGAWQRRQPLSVHGWIYALKDGRLRDLGVTVDEPGDIPQLYRMNLI
jgi:carbonic anhydrase